MIVVDSSVLAAFAIRSDAYSPSSLKTHALDPDWHAPELARSEFRSIAAGYLRRGESKETVLSSAALADKAARFHRMETGEVFLVIEKSPLSAYDAEFVALAQRLGCKLVTTDAEILRSFPDTAVRLKDFVA